MNDDKEYLTRYIEHAQHRIVRDVYEALLKNQELFRRSLENTEIHVNKTSAFAAGIVLGVGAYIGYSFWGYWRREK